MKKVAICPPDWYMRSAVYQINPRTFSKEGTIAAVTKELPSLKKLGFKTMYLCPVFEEFVTKDKKFWSKRQIKYGTNNPKNPYIMNDYFEIDSEYGTMADLKEFVEKAHKLDMKVLLDLVYYHCGVDAKFLKQNPEFAVQDENGNIAISYWNTAILDFNCDGLREYLYSNMVYYMTAVGVDGFRCDVGFKIPVDFWVEARRRIKAIKPDAVLLNEGSNWSYCEKAFDSTYCVSWHENVNKFIKNLATAKDVRNSYEEIANSETKNVCLLRDLENHDTVTDWPIRDEIAAGHDGMELVQVMNYCIDGVPMVYCGNELADTAKVNMFANRFFMGDYEVTNRKSRSKAAKRRMEVMTKLNQYRRSSDLLCYGKTKWIDNTEDEKILSFERTFGDEKLLFVGNLTKEAVSCSLSTDFLTQSAEKIFESEVSVTFDNKGNFNLPAKAYVVFKI